MGVTFPMVLCVRSSLYSCRQVSITICASCTLTNQCSFKHSSRNRPLKLSNKDVLDRFPRLNEVQPHSELIRPRLQGRSREFRAVVEEQGLRQRPCGRSRIRHTRAAPCAGPPGPSFASAGAVRVLPPDRSVRPSCDSRAILPGGAARRSAGSPSVAWCLHSPESFGETPGPLVGDSDTATCSDPAPRGDTPAVGSAQSVQPDTGPPPSSPWALPDFCGDRFQRLNVQRLLGHHLLQPPVFLFELAPLLHVADFQARILRPPLIECRVEMPCLRHRS
jgi:hypothetical protein